MAAARFLIEAVFTLRDNIARANLGNDIRHWLSSGFGNEDLRSGNQPGRIAFQRCEFGITDIEQVRTLSLSDDEARILEQARQYLCPFHTFVLGIEVRADDYLIVALPEPDPLAETAMTMLYLMFP
ncbi:hypothetical protein [Nocardia brasiliensis]|uniref:hypothetical protein n=1 Tax=Nocardia brasiliensis TaxID=37326 RepID=UPI001EEAE385|nr:hypothetical protein [Nocardia brasiliensis]